MRLLSKILALSCAFFTISPSLPTIFPFFAYAAEARAGQLIRSTSLSPAAQLSGAARQYRFWYYSASPQGIRPVSAALYIPRSNPPAGGWPLIAWAHGTVGLGDSCAPSIVGSDTDSKTYLSDFLQHGFAIVATDYVGLGTSTTSGVMPYLNGPIEAHNVIDSVTAAHQVVSQLNRKWIVDGQSQGGAASIFTSRYATKFSAPGMDFLGGIATGVPVAVSSYFSRPNALEVLASSPRAKTYALYALAGLNSTFPRLKIPSYLSPIGKEILHKAETMCLEPLTQEVQNYNVPSLFINVPSKETSRILATAKKSFDSYSTPPESGFDHPLYIGQGLLDTDIITPATLAWAQHILTNHERYPITVETFPLDHTATFIASQNSALDYAQRLLSNSH